MLCDLTIAADNASFGEPEVRFSSVGPALVMPMIVGYKKARELLYFGDTIDAATALELGMVNRVVPLADLDTTVMEIANKIAAMPRMALTLTKKAINFAEDAMGLREGIDHSFALHQLAHASSAEVSGGDAILGATPKSLKNADKG
jgi:enoyl-CoA hydratase